MSPPPSNLRTRTAYAYAYARGLEKGHGKEKEEKKKIKGSELLLPRKYEDKGLRALTSKEV